MLVFPVIALLAIGSTSVSADNYVTYNLLKNDRAAGRLVFPPTTLAQKKVILSNVENAFAVWVNYDSKKANYGPAADPFPTIKRLRKTIKKITDEELQLGITDAFIMARDRHTRWTNIAPYGCFHATTGVTFTFIEGDPDITKKPTVVVTSTAKSSELLALFGEDYSKIKAGDELLAINGLSFVKWFEKNQFTSGGGANEFGGQRTALEYLTTIYGKINRLPSDDSINFQFKSRANPEIIYTVNVPYVSGRNEDCWELGSKLYKSLPSITLPGAPATSLLVSAEQPGHSHGSDTAHPFPGGHQTDSPKDPKKGTNIDQISNSRQRPAVSMNPTDVTEVTWGIYQPESTNMGIIKLGSFDPEETGTKSLAIEKAIMIVRSLLVNELKDTNSVIYELRGNPGGSAKFADSMVQLFKPDFEPFGSRYLMNDLTYDIFVVNKNPNVNLHARAWKETEPGSRFTDVFFLHSTESVNTLGQVYLRPMGVFNDAMCYSSCELFSGNIQGHGAGTIFGEDEQTGGGGAIAKKLDPSLLRFGFEDFRKFPFTQELTSGSKTHANTLSVGVTQVVRTGLYKGQIIEDVGIKTDTVFRPQWSDLQPDSPTNTQYDRIAESLARTGQENGQSRLHFVCEPFLIVKPINGFSLEVETAGIERFTVFQADGKTIIAKKRRRSVTNKQKFAIPVSADAITLGNSQIIIVGKTAGVQVLKTKRNVRIIPDDDKYMEISTSGFTFTGLSDSVGLYQSPATVPGNGWNNLKGPWMIGSGVRYVENIDSSIEAFFSAPVGTNINIGIDVALDSMPGHDFLYLYVKSSDGVEDFLLRSKNRDGAETLNGVSGLDMIVKETFPFTTKSGKFSIALKFISNRSREFAGATINSFTVSAA